MMVTGERVHLDEMSFDDVREHLQRPGVILTEAATEGFTVKIQRDGWSASWRGEVAGSGLGPLRLQLARSSAPARREFWRSRDLAKLCNVYAEKGIVPTRQNLAIDAVDRSDAACPVHDLSEDELAAGHPAGTILAHRSGLHAVFVSDGQIVLFWEGTLGRHVPFALTFGRYPDDVSLDKARQWASLCNGAGRRGFRPGFDSLDWGL